MATFEVRASGLSLSRKNFNTKKWFDPKVAKSRILMGFGPQNGFLVFRWIEPIFERLILMGFGP